MCIEQPITTSVVFGQNYAALVLKIIGNKRMLFETKEIFPTVHWF